MPVSIERYTKERNKIYEKMKLTIELHRKRLEQYKGNDPANQLREEGALNVLEVLWIQLLQEDLMEEGKQ